MQRVLVSIACPLFLISCLGGDEDVASRYIVSEDVAAASGIDVTIAEDLSPELAGTRLLIPPGALQSDIHLTISLEREAFVGGDERAASPVIVLEPIGTELGQGAELTLPVDVAVDLATEVVVFEGRDTSDVELARVLAEQVSGGESMSATTEIPVLARYQLSTFTYICGNGIVEAGEQCDDGNSDFGDGCTPNCQLEAYCGNGIVEAGEECDDGNNTSGDGCNVDCYLEGPVCGNGIVEAGEECDDGNNTSGDGCNVDCYLEGPVCGNGIVEAGEQCDDGNFDFGDGCTPNCQLETPVCGNGIVEAGEECDDGNTDSGDGCNPNCQLE